MKIKRMYWLPSIIIIGFSLADLSCSDSEKELQPIAPKPKQTIGIKNLDYEHNLNMLHYVLVFIEENDLETLRKNIREFNLKNYNEKLGLNAIIIIDSNEDENKKNKVIAIRRFDNFEIAEEYLPLLKGSGILEESTKIVSISQDNYRRLLSKKNIREYVEFYGTIKK